MAELGTFAVPDKMPPNWEKSHFFFFFKKQNERQSFLKERGLEVEEGGEHGGYYDK